MKALSNEIDQRSHAIDRNRNLIARLKCEIFVWHNARAGHQVTAVRE
jgi:hypothetical protein